MPTETLSIDVRKAEALSRKILETLAQEDCGPGTFLFAQAMALSYSGKIVNDEKDPRTSKEEIQALISLAQK